VPLGATMRPASPVPRLHSLAARRVAVLTQESLLPQGGLADLPSELLEQIMTFSTPLTLPVLQATAGPGVEAIGFRHCVAVDHRWAQLLRLCPLASLDLTASPAAHINDMFMHCLTQFGKDDTIPPLCYTLDTLTLPACPHLSNDGLRQLLLFPQLLVLQLPYASIASAALSTVMEGLPALQSLSIAYCQKVTHLRFLEYAPQLRVLNLSRNGGWSAEALAPVGQLQDLRSLKLRDCRKMKDDALRVLVNTPRLHLLDLQGCTRLTGAIASTLEELLALKYLSLAETKICDAALCRLAAKLSKLECLHLSHCTQLTSAGIQALSSMPSLIVLHADALEEAMQDSALALLAALAGQLKVLHCKDSALLTDEGGLTFLGGDIAGWRLSHLELLNLQGSCIGSRSLQRLIRACPSLTGLDVARCMLISASALESLPACAVLQALDISALDISALVAKAQYAAYPPLPLFPASLCSLELNGCQGLPGGSDSGYFVVALARLPHLQRLGLAEVLKDDATLMSLKGLWRGPGAAFPSLRSLSVAHCSRLSSEGLQCLVEAMDVDMDTEPPAMLQELNFSGCSGFGDSLLQMIGGSRRCQALERLDIGGCPQIRDTGLLELSSLSRLYEVNVTGTTTTDAGMATLAAAPLMRTLDVQRRQQGLENTSSKVSARTLESSPLLQPSGRRGKKFRRGGSAGSPPQFPPL